MTTPCASIHRLGRRGDLALAALDIVFRPDADGAQMGLRAHHMLHRRDEFLGEAAMGNKNNSDHEDRPLKAGKIGRKLLKARAYLRLVYVELKVLAEQALGKSRQSQANPGWRGGAPRRST